MDHQLTKTIITFKALRNGRVVYKHIPIYHNFKELPETDFNGIKLPSTSVESQVINYLDEIDKCDMMIKHNFDIIIDYFPKKKKVKNMEKNEIETFIEFCKPYLAIHPSLIRPFEATISEAKDVLFGKNKSNEQKLKEVLTMINVAFKSSVGTVDLIKNLLNKENNYCKCIK